MIYALEAYARRTGRWKAFDSSGGFRLPDRSVLSPDASLVRLDRWQALTPEQRRSFPPLCPDLEELSKSELVRRALWALSALDQVADLVGICTGAPADLASNPDPSRLG